MSGYPSISISFIWSMPLGILDWESILLDKVLLKSNYTDWQLEQQKSSSTDLKYLLMFTFMKV